MVTFARAWGNNVEVTANYYRTVVIDPPWPGPGASRPLLSNKKRSVLPYSTMTGIKIASLRMRELCTDDAQCWLWATSRSLGDAELLLNMWGFSYAGLYIWKKPPGMGVWCRHDSEFLLRGYLPGAEIKLPALQQTFNWPRPKRHSEKPAEAYSMIAEYCPAPRLDIFSRQNRPGFDLWGNEAPGE